MNAIEVKVQLVVNWQLARYVAYGYPEALGLEPGEFYEIGEDLKNTLRKVIVQYLNDPGELHIPILVVVPLSCLSFREQMTLLRYGHVCTAEEFDDRAILPVYGGIPKTLYAAVNVRCGVHKGVPADEAGDRLQREISEKTKQTKCAGYLGEAAALIAQRSYVQAFLMGQGFDFPGSVSGPGLYPYLRFTSSNEFQCGFAAPAANKEFGPLEVEERIV